MGYRFLSSAYIDSDDCLQWERRFKECSMQWLNHNQLLPSIDGRYVTLNATPLMEAIKNTDWRVSEKSFFYRSIDGPLKLQSGLGKPINDTVQIFLLKDKRVVMNTDMHRGALGYAKPECDDLLFDDYDTALKYALSLHRNTESSLWQYCINKFQLLHDLVGQEESNESEQDD